jgi:type III secretion protein HrpB1
VFDVTACPDKLVSALIELLVTSMNRRYLSEAGNLLAALHLMRPRFRELHVYDVWLLMKEKRFAEATQLLRELEAQPLQDPFGSYVGALLAICLFSVGDPSWRVFANQVLARDEDEEAVSLVNILLGNRKRTAEQASQSASDATAAHSMSPYSTSFFMRV